MVSNYEKEYFPVKVGGRAFITQIETEWLTGRGEPDLDLDRGLRYVTREAFIHINNLNNMMFRIEISNTSGYMPKIPGRFHRRCRPRSWSRSRDRSIQRFAAKGKSQMLKKGEKEKAKEQISKRNRVREIQVPVPAVPLWTSASAAASTPTPTSWRTAFKFLDLHQCNKGFKVDQHL